MSLLKQIDETLVTAMKSGDKDTTGTLRFIKSDLKYYQIDNKLDKLTDEDVIAVLTSAAKRRRDSIEQFKAGGRDDLVAKETKELELIQKWLPEMMSEEDIESLAKVAIAEAGATSAAELGKVMQVLMPKVKGKADGKIVNQVVRKLLIS